MVKTFDTQVRAQQHLLRVVPQGYYWWTSGVVLPERKDALAEKFADLYGTTLGKDRRYVRKSKGLANAEAVCVVDGSVYRWFLVVTDGEGVVHDSEKLKDARTSSGRIRWADDYVLQDSRRPTTRGGGNHWSWWLTPEAESMISRYVDRLAKSNPSEMATYVEFQLRRPLHSGVRTQMGRILRRAKKLHAHHFPTQPWPCVEPDELPFISGFRAAQCTSGKAG